MFLPIGFVKNEVMEKIDQNWGDVVSEIIINDELQEGLQGLDEFSHIMVIYHLHEALFIKDKHIVRRPQGRQDMPLVGLFAQRVKDRPNAIGTTVVKLLSVQGNILKVSGLDAINQTPILDIKPYFPQFDLVKGATVPAWVDKLMQDYF